MDVGSPFTNIPPRETIEVCSNEPFEESESNGGQSKSDL